MATWREQWYPNRGTGWVVECSDCGWWKAPVWNRLDAICDCGTHEMICPGPTPHFFAPAPGKTSSSEGDEPIRGSRSTGDGPMAKTDRIVFEHNVIGLLGKNAELVEERDALRKERDLERQANQVLRAEIARLREAVGEKEG